MREIRIEHEMRERGVSVDAYASVAVANLAANAQLEKLKDKELARELARESGLGASAAKQLVMEAGRLSKASASQFKCATKPDGTDCWSWSFSRRSTHQVKHTGSVRVVRMRVLSEL
jgi:hypothetical protein